MLPSCLEASLAASGEPCWIAVDIGLTTDLTAVVACWGDGEDGLQVWPWFFCPEDGLEARAYRDKVPYVRWRDEDFITATAGNVTDYRAVEAHIRGLCERFRVEEIAFDPAYAQAVMGPLTEDGFPTATMRQGWVTMAPAIKETERAIIGRRFRHGGHPVLRWCFENVWVESTRPATELPQGRVPRPDQPGPVSRARGPRRGARLGTAPPTSTQRGSGRPGCSSCSLSVAAVRTKEVADGTRRNDRGYCEGCEC